MTTKINGNIKAVARAKLARLQKSSKYHSFFNPAAIDAFTKVERSAFAGKSLKDVSEQS
ncbi:hypothetical protein D3C84_398220 [compost metagenome]